VTYEVLTQTTLETAHLARKVANKSEELRFHYLTLKA